MPRLFGKIFDKGESNSPQRIQPMLSLSISAGVVKASVWELQQNTVEILGLGVKTYSESGKEKQIDYKELLDKTADAIDIACQVAETDVKKTVFGLPQVWIEEEELLPEYDNMMERLAKTLDLESVAYVSIPHAISYYIQYLHKTAPTTVMIGSSREGAYLSYVENGKILESRYVSWAGGSLGKNIDKGLLQFQTLKNFPASFCLYGYGDLIAARSELSKYAWSATDRLGEGRQAPTFVSTPKILVLEEHVDALAVSLVGAKDFARQNNIQGRLQIKSLEYKDLNSDALAIQNDADLLPAIPEKNPNLEFASLAATPIATNTTAGTAAKQAVDSDVPFGFVMNKDITNHDTLDHDPTVEDQAGDDVTLNSVQNDEQIEPVTTAEELPVTDWRDVSNANEETEEMFEEKHSQYDKPWVNTQKQKFSPFNRSALSKTNIFSGRKTKQMLIGGTILAVVVLLASAGAGWAYWNLPKATVTVYVKPENLEKQLQITANEKAPVSNDTNSVPATIIKVELHETKSADTTGKRQTGQVAKGQVTISNKTGSEKTFTSGSSLIGPGNIKFTLTENVSVASASAQSTENGETKTYGKANVQVTAVDIGPEGNLTKDTSLSIPPFTKDDFEAKVAVDFTGGTKKDIRVVSSADRTTVAKELRTDLQTKISAALKEKLSSDHVLLENAWLVTGTTEKFNKNVNDEADQVTVDTTMKVDGYVFNKSDVEKLLANSSTAAIPDGYDVKDKNTGVKMDFVTLDKSGTLTFKAGSVSTIIPRLNEKDIARSIVGKKEQAAVDTIKANSKVFDVTIDYSVTLPSAFQTLPHIDNNITVKRGVR
jgi:hypothetical protein